MTRSEKNVLTVGTRKGAFVFTSTDGRRTWKVSGPHFKGKSVFHITYDKRNGMLIASALSGQWGPTIARSFDLGKTWKESKPPKFPKASGESVANIWSIRPSTEEEPDTIYCGVEKAALFKSEDSGETWKLNSAMFEHETRPKWTPGGGGLCLHTILVDEKNPKNIHVAISAVGTLNSKDGGLSWRFQNKNVLADFIPLPANQYPEYGQCVHKLARHPEKPDLIYQQNHCGIFRTDNGGEDWKDIRNNLPSRFGFPIAVDANDYKRAYVAPLEADSARISPNSKFAVWTTDNSGKEWYPLSKGFPNTAYFTVLRDGMVADREDPCGLYVGTTTGHLYASRNHGNSWTKISDALPPILSVSAN